MKIRSIATALTVLSSVIFLHSNCTQPELEYKKISGSTQGTSYNITYEYKSNKDLQPNIDQVLHEFDLSLSTYDSTSIISKVNNNDPSVVLDYKFIKVFEVAREVYERTGGAFDITVAPIVNAWGFGFAKRLEVDTALIDSLIQYVGMDKISIVGSGIMKENPSIMLDVNAIAQGYSVDVVAAFLDEKKVTNYLVEIGGELKCKGKNAKGEDWKIGIDRPVDGNMIAGQQLQAIVTIKTKSLATSGNYRKFYEKDGIKYAHSINPKTGYPVLSRLLSITILAEECITADAYATACMVMGLEKSIELLSSHEELEGYLVYSDDDGNYQVFTSDGMANHVLEQRK